jgi:hypothetical protein
MDRGTAHEHNLIDQRAKDSGSGFELQRAHLVAAAPSLRSRSENSSLAT